MYNSTYSNGIHKGRGYRAVLSSRTLVVGLIAYFVFQTGNFAAMSFFGSWFSRTPSGSAQRASGLP